MSQGAFTVWARRSSEPHAHPRLTSDFLDSAREEFEHIAQSGPPDGAVSVWIEINGRIIDAAGEKAREINWTPYARATAASQLEASSTHGRRA